ncbi:hypothetical protein M0805_000259 [Coniferiporia weirii]|nr:hypothetical protein M0805_000259 [Coniferiporia weirii]
MFVANAFIAFALAASVTPTSAIYWLRPRPSTSSFQASSFAGETSSAVFPVPNATNAASSLDSFFPDATVVGFAGPTPTGDEAEVIATATSVPKVTDAFPLLNPSTFDNKSSFNVLRTWGNLSPFFSVDSFGLPEANMLVPEGCELTQVHLTHRHGARYPTSGEAPSVFAAKVHNASATGFTAEGKLAFLNTWTYKLGAELLTPFGRKQLFELGIGFRVEYGELLKNFTGLPVFRTTSEERMVQSALNFAAGFFGVPDYTTDYRQLITIESDGFNNTLAPYDTCTNSNTDAIGYFGDAIVDNWNEIYLQDALRRLQPMVDGMNLTITDVSAMQQLCAYETVALGTSAFCDLFTQEEWEGFEYSFDLDFWYNDGPGNPTSASQGIGYVQELVSRLTQTPITVFNSSTNATIVDNDITFPLYQPIFVDATHDTIIAAITVALNFTSFAANGPLPTDHIPKDQTYFANKIAPFASRLVGQVLSCPARSASTRTSNTTSSTSTSYFRWLLNDAVVPLTGMTACPEDKDGLCPFDTYISALQTRLGEVDFEFDCFGNYTVPNPDLITDGRPPASVRPN